LKMTLRKKTSLLFSLLVGVAVTVTGVFYLRFLESSLERSVTAGLKQVCLSTSYHVEWFVQEALRDARAIAAAVAPAAAAGAGVGELEGHLARMFDLYPEFENGLFLLDAQGVLVADHPPHREVEGRSLAFREYFQETVKRKTGVVGVPYRSARTGDPVLTFTAPVQGEDGRITAVLGCSVRLLSAETFGNVRRLRVGTSGHLYLIDRQGKVFLDPHGGLVLGRFPAEALDRVVRSLDQGVGSGILDLLAHGPHLFAARSVSGTDWVLMALEPRDDAFEPIREARWRILAGIMASIFAAVVVGTFAVRKITAPLSQLRDSVRELAEKNGGTWVPAAGSMAEKDVACSRLQATDEIDELACCFDDMARRLERTIGRLRAAAMEWQRTFNAVEEGVFVLDEAFRVVRVNRSALRLLHVSEEEILGRVVYPFIGGDSNSEISCSMQSRPRSGRYKTEVVNASLGKVFEMTETLLTGDDGATAGSVLVIDDITDRKRSEQALRENEEKYRLIVENQTDLVVKVDPEGRFLFVSPSYGELFGMTEEELLGKAFMPLVHEEDREKTLRAMESLKQPPHTCYVEQRVLTRKGWRRLAWADKAILDEAGQVAAVVGVGRDITKRREAEEALADSEERYRSLVENTLDGYFMCEYPTGPLIFFNQRICDMFGYRPQEVHGMTLWDALDPSDVGAGRKRFDSKLARDADTMKPRTYRLRRKDGSLFVAEVVVSFVTYRGKPVIQGMVRDITERRQMQKQLMHAQKMEAVGTLAGGIAHDFNNLLQSIQGYTELLLMGRALDPHQRRSLERVLTAAKRGAELTGRLLTFSRRVESRLQPMDLNREIVQACSILERTIPKMIRIDLRLADGLKAVLADPAQIEQVLVNLAVNARDAMPDGGAVTIETANVRLSAEDCKTGWGLVPGDYVRLSVSDTGTGMDPGTLKHLFEPFYTTKAVGKGTGLGLAMVYGIVKNHGGHILCRSEKNRGTTFTLYLQVNGRPEAARPLETPGPPAQGKESILVVDDEPMVRELAEEILRSRGYEVQSASDGETALSIFEKGKGRIALVILDLIMPGMGGRQCLERLLRIDPGARVLIASGYALDAATQEAIDAGAQGFVKKPYELQTMLEAVRRILVDGAPRPRGDQATEGPPAPAAGDRVGRVE